MSIRSKIFMLVAFGIIGVAGISGFAKYSGVKKDAYMTVLQQSQTVETVMLQIMMAEEKFINTLDSKELSGLGDYKRRLDEALTRIKSFDAGAGISDSATLVSQTEVEHSRIFQVVAQALDDMSKAKADLFAKTESVNTHVKESIGIIDKEEAMLFPQGETLPPDKTELRKELSDLLVLLSDRIMNIQDLLLYGNASKYQETRQAIEKKLELRKKNISVSVPTMKDFIQPWKATKPILAEIAGDDSIIFDLWGKNNEAEENAAKYSGTDSREIKKYIRSLQSNPRKQQQVGRPDQLGCITGRDFDPQRSWFPPVEIYQQVFAKIHCRTHRRRQPGRRSFRPGFNVKPGTL